MKTLYNTILILSIVLFNSTILFSANLTNLNFKYVNPTDSQLKNKSILISPGVTFKLGDYLNKSSFKKQRDFSPIFKSNFTKKFLKKPAKYKETIEGLGDRLKVTRTLTVDFKNPCDPKIPKGQSFCFKPTKKKMSKAIKKDLALMRTKLKKKLSVSKRPKEQKKIKHILKMSDKKLLGYVLNKSNTQKTITHTSFVPLVSLDPKRVRNLDLSKLNKPLPKKRFNANATRNLNITKKLKHPLKSIPRIRSQASNSNERVYEFDNTNEYTKNLVMGKVFGNSYSNQFEITFVKETSWHNRYYLGLYFNLGYKFGFQFPFKLKVNTEITHVYQEDGRRQLARYPANSLCPEVTRASDAHLCAAIGKATITASAASISESNPRFYRLAGIPSAQVDDKEFIFEIEAKCSMIISVPGSKTTYPFPGSTEIDEGQHFKPPLGQSNEERLFGFYIPAAAARAVPIGVELGIAYGILMPGVAVKGEDGFLTFDVVPDNSTFIPELNKMTLGTNSKSFKVKEKFMRTQGADWGFKIKNPEYSFKASLLPSFKAQLGIDYVYEWHNTFGPFDLDSIRINLGEFNFSRLSSTTREHKFKVGTRKEN